ncbi:2-oxoacid:acceptor oxidoreductase subunit alpha [Candidatus Dojkabacteria bacterium]|nr:2-oxoacid:acceptor oxidoreductase subunit alpha [Candidatus Dojkabacteria bacterium]
MNRFSIKIGGPAGAGIKSIGLLLQKTLQTLGFYTFGYTEYPSLIRGGHNTFQVDFSVEPIASSTQKIDILLALDEETLEIHIPELSPNGVIIYDKTLQFPETDRKDLQILALPIKETLEQNKYPAIMQNSVQMGVIMATCDYPIDALNKTLSKIFAHKSEDIIKSNQAAAKLGFDLVEGTKLDIKTGLKLPENPHESLVLTANEACALSFISSGGKFYSAYPMTPATNILHYLAKHGPQKGVVVRQSATEIEAIGVALGASFGGLRSMVGTSGGGYDLMTEFVSVLGISEIPMVIINAQRTGPATGLPTWQEQSDLNMVKFSSHGEFPRIVIAPGDPEEAYELTAEALNMADKYQCPVIILTDKHVAESFYDTPEFKPVKVDRGKLITSEKDIPKNFLRYTTDTHDGITSRTIPGLKDGIYVANSDEHSEEGYSTEDMEMRIKQQDKRMKKVAAIKSDLPQPEITGPKNAKTLIIGWGSTKGAIEDAIKQLNNGASEQSGNEAVGQFAFLQLKYLYPLDHEKLGNLLRPYKKLILIENNSTGQLKDDLALAGRKPDHVILRYDGKPFFVDELVEQLTNLIK